MARAKRTDRTEARRRHRAEQAALDPVEPGTEEAVATATAKGAPKSAGKAAPPPRPSIVGSLRGAIRPLDLRGDLLAIPVVVSHWGFLAALGLSTLTAVWFVIAYSGAMEAIPVGTATTEQMQAVVAANQIPFLLLTMMIQPPPAIGAFLIGFTAKRASWLGGLIYGIFVTILAIIVLQTPAGRLLATTATGEGPTQAVIIAHAAWSPIGAALLASAAAWYRRFLDLANPNKNQAAQAKGSKQAKPQGRGDVKPARR